MADDDKDSRISLKYFDLESVKPESVCVFLGKRCSGKTTGILDLMHSKKEVNRIGFVMSKTDKFQKDFENIMPPKMVYNGYRPDKVKNLLDRQEDAITNNLKPLHAFLVMDDVIADRKVWNKDKT
jgi:hypothetical protein